MKYTLKATTMLMFLMLSLTAWAGDKTVGEVVDDSLIHTKVKTALIGHEAHDINIEVHEGVVLLAGWVPSANTHEAAVKAASGVEGVREVTDHLYVQDQPRQPGVTIDDGVIAARVKAELASNEQTNGFDINVEVRSGVVLLSGFVKSTDEAKTAIELTRNTQGVTDVLNGMEIVLS